MGRFQNPQSELQSHCNERKLWDVPPSAVDVLIVEDDAPTQSFLLALCNRLGLTTSSALDGDRAITSLGDVDPAVILLDLYLPKANGFDVLKWISDSAPHMMERVIVLTAASEHDLDKASKLGRVHRLLRKPVDLRELTTNIFECRDASRASASPVSH
jgi:CheY-like chemotaxis protein